MPSRVVEQTVGVLTARGHAVQAPVDDHRVDLRAPLLPPHGCPGPPSSSGNATFGRARTVAGIESNVIVGANGAGHIHGAFRVHIGRQIALAAERNRHHIGDGAFVRDGDRYAEVRRRRGGLRIRSAGQNDRHGKQGQSGPKRAVHLEIPFRFVGK